MGIFRPSIGDYYDKRIEAMKNEIRRLSRDRVLYDRERQTNTLADKYTIQEINPSGEPKKDVSADTSEVTIRIPVERNNEIPQLLKLESHGVSYWLDLDYRDGFVVYRVPADGDPAQVKERIQNTISHIRRTEIDPRNAEIRNGNDRVMTALNELLDQLQAQFKAQDERRGRLEDELR